MGIFNNNKNNDNVNNNNNNNNIRQFIETENSKYQVVIWSKSYCPYCANTKQLFNNNNHNKLKQPPKSIKIYELDEMGHEGIEIQKELYNITKQTTVPNIFINTKHIGGNDNVQKLYQNGQLQKQLLL